MVTSQRAGAEGVSMGICNGAELGSMPGFLGTGCLLSLHPGRSTSLFLGCLPFGGCGAVLGCQWLLGSSPMPLGAGEGSRVSICSGAG